MQFVGIVNIPYSLSPGLGEHFCSPYRLLNAVDQCTNR